jgi:acyl-CoA thioesterase YciA
MPADTNQNGDIFGGWLLSQMDIGGGIFASKITKSRAVTVTVEAMNFGAMKPTENARGR